MMMYFFLDQSEHFYRKRTFLLTGFFILGHLLGILVSGYASSSLLSAMRTVVSSRVSIIGLLSAPVLPFLFSAFAVYLKQPVLLFPIAFWKAFMFAYAAGALCAAWGSAGWLIMPLAMFGSICAMPVLYWYWWHHLDGRPFRWDLFFLMLAVLSAIGIVDWCFIESFLARIISF